MSGLVQWNMFLNAHVRIKAEVAASFDRRTAHRESRKAPQSRHDLVVHVARRAHFQFFCRVPFARIFRFTRRANHLYKLGPSRPTEGRHAIVTVAGRDAVDADALLTNGADADGEVVWS